MNLCLSTSIAGKCRLSSGTAPVADFTGTPLSGSDPLDVTFTDASTNTPTSWWWEKSANSGSVWSSFSNTPSSQNPTETLIAGVWSIRCTVTNNGGSDTKTRIDYVSVESGGG